MIRVWLLLIFLGFTADLYADNARSCIEIKEGERSRSIHNTCDYQIEVLWCHNLDQAGYDRNICGERERFYQRQAVLQPDEEKQNKYALPFSGTLYIAACRGGFNSVISAGDNGGYICRDSSD